MTPDGNPWFATTKFDPRAVGIFQRHYSYRHGNRRAGITGPGESLTLLTQDCRALWVWRYAKYSHFPIQNAAYCAVFRNEGEHQSSDLIRWAADLAWVKWPGKQLFTFVDPKAIQSVNPGYCFKAAGWEFAGRTKRGLHILTIHVPTVPMNSLWVNPSSERGNVQGNGSGMSGTRKGVPIGAFGSAMRGTGKRITSIQAQGMTARPPSTRAAKQQGEAGCTPRDGPHWPVGFAAYADGPQQVRPPVRA